MLSESERLFRKRGFMADVGDVETMAKYGIEILSNPELYKMMRKAAVDRAGEFSIEKILPMYEDLYARALKSVKK